MIGQTNRQALKHRLQLYTYRYCHFCSVPSYITVVGDYINTMKTTFLFKFRLLTSFFRIKRLHKQDTRHTMRVSINRFIFYILHLRICNIFVIKEFKQFNVAFQVDIFKNQNFADFSVKIKKFIKFQRKKILGITFH